MLLQLVMALQTVKAGGGDQKDALKNQCEKLCWWLIEASPYKNKGTEFHWWDLIKELQLQQFQTSCTSPNCFTYGQEK